MERSSSKEADARSAAQTFLVLCGSKINYRSKKLLLNPILEQMKSVHTTTFCFFEIIVILSSHLRVRLQSGPSFNVFQPKLNVHFMDINLSVFGAVQSSYEWIFPGLLCSLPFTSRHLYQLLGWRQHHCLPLSWWQLTKRSKLTNDIFRVTFCRTSVRFIHRNPKVHYPKYSLKCGVHSDVLKETADPQIEFP
jgi:hypothetical protein